MSDYRETVEKLRTAKNYLPLAVCPDIDAGIALLTEQEAELATLRAKVADLDGKLTFNETGYRHVHTLWEVEQNRAEAAEAELATLRAENAAAHQRLNETSVAGVKGDLYTRISAIITKLSWEKSEHLNAELAEKAEHQATRALLTAAEHRRAQAEYRAATQEPSR